MTTRRKQRIYQRRWIEGIGEDAYRELRNSLCRKYRSKPWVKTYLGIKQRLKRSKNLDKWGNGYRCYVGIENFLTTSDLKILWERDKASEMIKPSIDRKESTGHYTIDNCQYVEMSKNRAKVLNPGPKIGDTYSDGRVCKMKRGLKID